MLIEELLERKNKLLKELEQIDEEISAAEAADKSNTIKTLCAQLSQARNKEDAIIVLTSLLMYENGDIKSLVDDIDNSAYENLIHLQEDTNDKEFIKFVNKIKLIHEYGYNPLFNLMI